MEQTKSRTLHLETDSDYKWCARTYKDYAIAKEM